MPLAATKQGRHDHPHLELRELLAKAKPAAPAEGEVMMWFDAVAEKTVRVEPVRMREALRPAMCQVDAGGEDRPRGEWPAAKLALLG